MKLLGWLFPKWMMTNTDSNIPILKWAGGKRWFVNRYNPLFPQKYSTYLEPFFGGGAVFFHLLPNRAILSDVNKELMNLYIAVKDYPEELNKLIKIHDTNHSKTIIIKFEKENMILILKKLRSYYISTELVGMAYIE